MFGYIITNAESLPKERQERFRGFYCGLCRRLRLRYGLVGSTTLSFDMTFLAVLLNALYEPDETEACERCVPHPFKAHDYVDTEVMDYVADMNVALAYHKCLDNWLDDRSVLSLSEAKLLKSAYRKVSGLYPQKCAAIERWLDDIHVMERSGLQAIDPPVNATGRLLGELFVYRDDVWADTLREVGDGLGRFIYLMDAWDDLPEDMKRKRYNPLKGYARRADYDAFCQSALMLSVADATRAFELLPIVRDADILRNILYSGVWSKYALIRNKRESGKKEKEHAGSL
ncbi:MAG: hypothetical protein IJ646_08775 [Clostridia bacterium]|nr:hypothetical protein [Clostridia bacterium]